MIGDPATGMNGTDSSKVTSGYDLGLEKALASDIDGLRWRALFKSQLWTLWVHDSTEAIWAASVEEFAPIYSWVSSAYWWKDIIPLLLRYGGGKFSYRWRGPLDSSVSSLIPTGWCRRASHHQKLAPTFPGIDSCLMVTKQDFLKMEASLWLNERSQDVAKGWLST